MPTQTTVYEDMKEILMEILGVDPEEITPTANFFHDLGGESIDVLDLSFHCERKFGQRFPFQDLADPTQFEIDANGQMLESSLSRLEERFPFLDLAKLRSDGTANDINSLFTVNTIVRFVEQILSEQEPEERVAS